MTTPQAQPTAFGDTQNLPRNIWAPAPGASIMVYWARREDSSFELALQLADRALLDDSDPGIIVWSTVGPDRPRLPFSLLDQDAVKVLMSGRFEWRQGGEELSQLWLCDASYPGGKTAAAQIA